MNTSPLILKSPKGWFAAGAEVQKAMTMLSDGAFKLFVYLCLNARRDNGLLETSQTDLARAVKKTSGTIRSHLREMEAAGICRAQFSHHPFARGSIQIAEPFWPYERTNREAPSQDGGDAFVSEIRKMLHARACVRTSFSVADEILARQWFARGIALERIQQAILLGCARKYASWRNNGSQAPISSLQYFQSILEELESQEIPPGYWDYVRFRLQRMETLWKEAHSKPVPGADEIAIRSEAGSPSIETGGARPKCFTQGPGSLVKL